MLLLSPAFHDDGVIPSKYARQGVVGGKNISPPLSWSDVPSETASLTISVIDRHPVANNWVHWIVVNIPAGTRSLVEGASSRNIPSGARELFNSFGERGYGGPQPPKGSGPHTYEFTLYAMSAAAMEISENTSLRGFQNAIEGKVLAKALLKGVFEQ